MGIFSRKKRYTSCSICGGELSKTGNYTNMILAGIFDPVRFNETYGMRCKDHAGELTEQIVEEKGLSEDDFEAAFTKAQAQVEKDLLG